MWKCYNEIRWGNLLRGQYWKWHLTDCCLSNVILYSSVQQDCPLNRYILVYWMYKRIIDRWKEVNVCKNVQMGGNMTLGNCWSKCARYPSQFHETHSGHIYEALIHQLVNIVCIRVSHKCKNHFEYLKNGDLKFSFWQPSISKHLWWRPFRCLDIRYFVAYPFPVCVGSQVDSSYNCSIETQYQKRSSQNMPTLSTSNSKNMWFLLWLAPALPALQRDSCSPTLPLVFLLNCKFDRCTLQIAIARKILLLPKCGNLKECFL